MKKTETIYVCNFCGKNQFEVEVMVAGPGVDICSECIQIAADVVKKAREEKEAAK